MAELVAKGDVNVLLKDGSSKLLEAGDSVPESEVLDEDLLARIKSEGHALLEVQTPTEAKKTRKKAEAAKKDDEARRAAASVTITENVGGEEEEDGESD